MRTFTEEEVEIMLNSRICDKPKTNADRIRSMSDDELTDIILCPYDTAGKPANIMPCVRDGNIQELVSPEYCKNA